MNVNNNKIDGILKTRRIVFIMVIIGKIVYYKDFIRITLIGKNCIHEKQKSENNGKSYWKIFIEKNHTGFVLLQFHLSRNLSNATKQVEIFMKWCCRLQNSFIIQIKVQSLKYNTPTTSLLQNLLVISWVCIDCIFDNIERKNKIQSSIGFQIQRKTIDQFWFKYFCEFPDIIENVEQF